MWTEPKKIRSAGFTLVEVLIVMVIMGVVVTAVYNLYTSTDKTANTSEEVVEVQQNLRIALDQIARDTRMAGFLIPNGSTPILAAPSGSTDNNDNGTCIDSGETPGPGAGNGCFSFQTATLSGRVARITGTPSGASPADANTGYLLTVGNAEMVDLFETGNWARIIRPADGSSPLDRIFKVSGTDRSPIPTLTLEGFTAATIYRPGDLIVRVTDPNGDHDDNANTSPPPAVITTSYRLVDDPTSSDPSMRVLKRTDSSGGTAEIAAKITGLQFSYLLDDGTEQSAVTSARLGEIAAVRVTISGATDATRTGNANYSGIKTRSVETVIRLRNR